MNMYVCVGLIYCSMKTLSHNGMNHVQGCNR